MGISVAVTRVACDTATGDQTITTADLGGLTPGAAIFIVSLGVTDATAADNAAMSFGVTDGTSQCVTSMYSEHGAGTTDCYRRGTEDEVVQLMLNDGTIDGEANFKNFTTNGVVITWGNACAAAYLLTVVFFAGTDLSAKVDVFTTSATDDDSVDVDVGFTPEQVFFLLNGAGFGDSAATKALMSLGFANNGGSITQGCTSVGSSDNVSTSQCSYRVSNTLSGINIRTDTGVASRSFEVTAFLSNGTDGFEATTREVLDAFTQDVGYLALDYSGVVDHWVGAFDTPTSTGNDAQAGPSFTPQFVMELPSWGQAYNTAYPTDAHSIGVGVIDADDEYCTSVSDEDNQGTTDTQSLSDDTAINFPEDDGTAGFVAAFVSFDANGWTRNFTTTDGTARKWVGLAIEEVSATTSTSTTTTVSSTSTSTTISSTSTSVTATSSSTTQTQSTSTSVTTTSSSTSTSVTTTSSSTSTTLTQSTSTSQTASSSTSTSVTTTSSSTTVSQSSSTSTSFTGTSTSISTTITQSTSTSVTTTSSSTTQSTSSSTTQTVSSSTSTSQTQSTSTSVTTTSSSTTQSQSSSTSTSVTTTSVSTSTTLTVSSSTSVSTTTTQSQSTSTTTTISLICCCCHTMFRGMFQGMWKGKVPG